MWLNMPLRGSIALVLLALNLVLLSGCSGSLVAFPSLTKTTGFAYVTNSNKMVPIPSALEHILCFTDGKPVNPTAAKRCSEVIIFTSDSTLTLEFLNLSSNGVVQPLTGRGTPRIYYFRPANGCLKTRIENADLSTKTANEVSATGNSLSVVDVDVGCLFENSVDSNLDENSDDDGDDDGDDEGDDDGDDEGDDDDAHGASTMASSAPAVPPKSPSPSTRRCSGAGVQTSPMPAPSSPTGQSAVHKPDDAVVEANKTSGFLDSKGAIVKNERFVLELGLSKLPVRKLFMFMLDFGLNGNSSLLIYSDPSPVSTNITQLQQGTEAQDKEDYTFEVKFSTRLLSKPDPKLLYCPSVTDPLKDLISAHRKSSLTTDHLLAVRKAAVHFSSCQNGIESLNPESLISVKGVHATMKPMKIKFKTCEITGGSNLQGPIVAVEFSIDKGREVEVNFSINGDSGVSFSGTPVSDHKESFTVGASAEPPAEPPETSEPVVTEPPAEPPKTSKSAVAEPPAVESSERSTDVQLHGSPKPGAVVAEASDSVNVAKLLGQITSSVVGASIGFSFVINVGTPFLIFVDPLRAFSAPKKTGSLSSSVGLLQAGQITYLMTKLAVPNLPKNFIDFGDQFYWTLLDFRAPWDARAHSDDESNTLHSSRRRLLGNETTTEDDDKEDDGNPYDQLEDTYFWLLISLLSLCVFHCILVGIYFHYSNSVPSILRFPRLELYLIQSGVAIIATGPAYLFTGDIGHIIVGVIILSLGIVPLFMLHLYVLFKYILTTGKGKEDIVYSLNSNQVSDRPMPPSGQSSPKEPASRGVIRENIQNEGDQSWFSKYIFSFLFGPLFRGGGWTTKANNSQLVIDRIGATFEDNRGVPMRENASESVPEEELIDRDGPTNAFEAVSREHRYKLDVPHYAYLMRVNESLLKMLKMVVITIIILGEDEAEKNSQAIVLLCIRLVYLVYLRVFRPPCKRRKLAVLMIEEALETLVVLLVICKLNTDHSKSREDIGTAMAVLQGIVLALFLMDVAITTRPMVQDAIRVFWKRGSHDTSIFGSGQSSQTSTRGFEEMVVSSIRSAVSKRVLEPLSKSLRSSARTRTSGNRVPLLNNQSNQNHALPSP